MTYRRKITAEQRHQLIQVHLHLGYEASRPLSIEFGVEKNYAAKAASQMNLVVPIYLRRKNAKRTAPVIVNHKDPRWAWAVERGAVVA